MADSSRSANEGLPSGIEASKIESSVDKESVDCGPGQLYEQYARSELVNERLKLLNYENDFVKKSESYRVLPRHYFVNATNPGEQFYLFTSLAVWLIKTIAAASPLAEGHATATEQLEMPHEFDDPNTTLQTIVDAARDSGIEVGFPSSRLKSGSGPQCLHLLDKLSEMALERSGRLKDLLARGGEITMASPQGGGAEEEEGDAEEGQLDDAELMAAQFTEAEEGGNGGDEGAIDDDVQEAEDEDDNALDIISELGPGFLGREALKTMSASGHQQPIDEAIAASKQPALKAPMRQFTDHESMQRELQRVIPQLKITIRSTQKDWRMHAEKVERMDRSLTAEFVEARPILDRHLDEMVKATERIASREQHLNEQFADLLHVYRLRQNELAEVGERYKESSGMLTNLTETLSTLNVEIDQIKQQIDEQSMHNINGAPILKVKQAITKLEKEILTMRVQVIATEQTLLQSQLADRMNIAIGEN